LLKAKPIVGFLITKTLFQTISFLKSFLKIRVESQTSHESQIVLHFHNKHNTTIIIERALLKACCWKHIKTVPVCAKNKTT